MIKRDVLQLLKENSRLPISDIAYMLNVSESKVEKTIKKLETEGVIEQYTILINEEKLDEAPPTIRALIEVSVQPEKNKGFDHIAKQVLQYENVVDHYLVSGSYDFLIVVEGESLHDISSFISKKLSSIKNVKGTRTHFILKKYKENGVVFGGDSSEHRLAVSP